MFAWWIFSVPSLLAINLMKIEIEIFQTVPCHIFGHLIKGSCLGVSTTMWAPCLLWCRCMFCRWRYVFYLSRDPTGPFCWDVMRIYGRQLLATCHHPDSLVTIGILINKRKNGSSKTSYKYVLTLKNWVD